jgi:hypothetical protein
MSVLMVVTVAADTTVVTVVTVAADTTVVTVVAGAWAWRLLVVAGPIGGWLGQLSLFQQLLLVVHGLLLLLLFVVVCATAVAMPWQRWWQDLDSTIAAVAPLEPPPGKT